LEKFCDAVEEIVFLGDYFDPYPDEGISEDDAVENWRLLCRFLSGHGLLERTAMLIGNHDAHYMSRVFCDSAMGTRRSKERAADIAALLSRGPLLRVAHEGFAGTKRILFTHAGVSGDWYSRHQSLVGPLSAGNLNRLTLTDEGWKALAEIGLSRLGFALTGSPLWADLNDHVIFRWPAGDQGGFDFQVFGHTRQDKPLVTKRFAMLDCRQCFAIDADCRLYAIEGL
jgi:hypothetical protein